MPRLARLVPAGRGIRTAVANVHSTWNRPALRHIGTDYFEGEVISRDLTPAGRPPVCGLVNTKSSAMSASARARSCSRNACMNDLTTATLSGSDMQRC
jgi:hypothetical protein